MLMGIAHIVAERSTCDRLMVGAVLSRDGRVLSTGYNGVPSGMPHCNHYADRSEPCLSTVHAEANAIVFAARHGVSTQDSVMHVTHSPCMVCARLIINAGIVSVVWGTPYRDVAPLELLEQAGVGVISL
jgi:dCMP deaminase